jgi:hypothetical protein
VVNGQRLKHYISGDSYNEDIDVIQVATPEEFIKDLIRLQRIYNFLCSMLIFTPFAYCFVTLRDTFMHFPELTY